MWICEKCKRENEDSVNYCEYCNHIPNKVIAKDKKTMINNPEKTSTVNLAINGLYFMMAVTFSIAIIILLYVFTNYTSNDPIINSLIYLGSIYTLGLTTAFLFGFIQIIELLKNQTYK